VSVLIILSAAYRDDVEAITPNTARKTGFNFGLNIKQSIHKNNFCLL
jgi:hypothetical protein